MYSRITGTGSYLPEKVLTNQDLEKMVDTSDQWIRERTGIQQRHIAAEGETTGDLAEAASRKAMLAAGIEAKDLDMLVLGTTTPDIVFPSTACLLQSRLGCQGVPAFDVNAACSGFMFALSIADQYIRSGSMKTVLVCGAETLTRMVDFTDRSTAVLFGDGAGACILQASEQPGILSTHIHANGDYAGLLNTAVGVSRGFDPGQPRAGVTIQMHGNDVFRVAVRTLSRAVDEALEANEMTYSDIDWLVPHQANLRIINATVKKLGLPPERVILTVGEHGNTSAASVPMALDQGVRSGKIKRGDTVLLEAFGGGFTWASTLLEY